MGVGRFNGIKQTTKKVNDLRKKQASGQENNADQSRVLNASARVDSIRAMIEGTRKQGLSFLPNESSTKKNEDFSVRKKHDGPKLVPQVPEAIISKYRAELSIAQADLEQEKQDFSKRMDEAVLSGSGEDLALIREEFQILKEASALNDETKDLLENPQGKNPELLKLISDKQNEVNSLSLDKSKPGRKQSLATAKNELAELKSQLGT